MTAARSVPSVVQRVVTPAGCEMPLTQWLTQLEPPAWGASGEGAFVFSDYDEAATAADRLKVTEMGGIFPACRAAEVRPELPPARRPAGAALFLRRTTRAMGRGDWHAGKPNCGVE